MPFNIASDKDIKIMNLQRIEPEDATLHIAKKRGMYFWFNKNDDSIVYIGIAIGTKGLRGRIVSQHLNQNYIEYRPEKQSKRDFYQLSYPFIKGNKKGIDKSAFRKSIGRKKELKPGEATVKYIKDNLYLRVFESEDKEYIKSMEKELIKSNQPFFNTAHK